MPRLITRFGTICGLALASLPLAACSTYGDGYGYGGVGSTWSGAYYDGWYDNYYGPIYDGYWGRDNYFYYRHNDGDRYRRGDRNHFHRGDRAPNSRFQRFEGRTQRPSQATRMPNYPRPDRNAMQNRAPRMERQVQRPSPAMRTPSAPSQNVTSNRGLNLRGWRDRR